MRSIIHEEFGVPAKVLQFAEVDVPQPGEGELLVRLLTRPIHRGVLLGVRGRYRAPGQESAKPEQPTLVGIEGLGVVEKVGAGVNAGRGLAEGARVGFFPVPGAWNDYAIVPAQWATVIPDDIPDAVAAQLHLNPVTALVLLRAAQAAGAGPDGPIVLDAAAGSVPKLVAALAKDMGISVTGVVRRKDPSIDLSVYDKVVSTSDADWQAQLGQASNGAGFKVGLVAVGGDTGTGIFESLGIGGALITYGDLSGEPMRINALDVAARMVSISGMLYVTWMGLSDEERAADIQSAIDLARSSPELFPVAAEYTLSDIKKAVVDAEDKTKSGLVLVTA